MAAVDRALIAGTSERAAEARRHVRSEPLPWRLIAGAGFTFALVGWTDVLLLWYPLRLGRPDWEFATVSGTFDALPLATIGALLLVAALHALPGRLWRRILGVALILLVVALLGALVLFALSFATGLGQVEGDTRWILTRAGIKTTVAAIAYITLYSAMALSLFRAVRKDRSI